MSVFDRICAGLAFLLGIVLVVLGLLGLFFGCRANFTLPPVLGGAAGAGRLGDPQERRRRVAERQTAGIIVVNHGGSVASLHTGGWHVFTRRAVA